MLPVILQVLQLRISDFAVNLRQRLEAAHRKQRVAERNDDRDERDRGQDVPLNQPSAFVGEMEVVQGSARGGICAGPCSSSVSGHQTRKITTMTVVICMIRSALPLDSCMPLMFSHQK